MLVHLFAFIPTLIIQTIKVVRDFIEENNEKNGDRDANDSTMRAA